MSVNILGQISTTEQVANIDELYGPYESKQAAWTAISAAERNVKGTTVGVIENGAVIEYWFKDNFLSIDDLVVKNSGGSGAELETTIDPENPSTNKAPSSKAVVDYVGTTLSEKIDGLRGGIISFIGDSIVYGSELPSSERTDLAYPFLVANKLGMTIQNLGIGGSTIAKGDYTTGYMQDEIEAISGYPEDWAMYDDGCVIASPSAWAAAKASGSLDTSKRYFVNDGINSDRWWRIYRYKNDTWQAYENNSSFNGRTPICDRLSEIRSDSDVIVVACGTNDFYYMWDEFGDPSGTTMEKNTFCGAVRYVADYLSTNFADRLIVFVDAIDRLQGTGISNGQWTLNSINQSSPISKTINDYNKFLYDICKENDFLFVDMYLETMFHPSIDNCMYTTSTNKAIHPNARGHAIMANRLVDALRSSGHVANKESITLLDTQSHTILLADGTTVILGTSSYSTNHYSVQTSGTVYATCRSGFSSAVRRQQAGVVCYDADNNFLGSFLTPSTATSYANEPIELPAGTRYVKVCGTEASGISLSKLPV